MKILHMEKLILLMGASKKPLFARARWFCSCFWASSQPSLVIWEGGTTSRREMLSCEGLVTISRCLKKGATRRTLTRSWDLSFDRVAVIEDIKLVPRHRNAVPIALITMHKEPKRISRGLPALIRGSTANV